MRVTQTSAPVLDRLSLSGAAPWRRAALAAGCAAALLLAPAAPALAQGKPTSLADLVDSVAEAVVNISATQTDRKSVV